MHMSDPIPAHDRLLWLSLGENCLPDDILKRHGRKSFSTPYSSGRSNIDYAIALERCNYEGLLDSASLKYSEDVAKPVVRSSRYQTSADIFDPWHSKGFEFTHHDVLKSAEALDSYRRKVDRLLDARGRQDVLFLYHHRTTARSDLAQLRLKLKEFQGLYQSGDVRCVMVLFHQSLIAEGDRRRLQSDAFGSDLLEFVLHTRFRWGGNDPEIFWARNDDDLFRELFAAVDQALGTGAAPPVPGAGTTPLDPSHGASAAALS